MPQRHFSLDDHCLYSVYFAPRGAVRMTVMPNATSARSTGSSAWWATPAPARAS